MNKQVLDILEDAILDVGYLNWWTEKLPEIFQIEFGGVQIYCEPETKESPSSSLLALKFSKLVSVSFISKGNVEKNWYELLHNNKFAPQSISYDRFSLTNHNIVKEIINIAKGVYTFFGKSLIDVDDEEAKFFLGFWAGDVGIIIYANELDVYNRLGKIPSNEIEKLNDKWWEYWRNYWELKKSGKVPPEDYACEVTLPINS